MKKVNLALKSLYGIKDCCVFQLSLFQSQYTDKMLYRFCWLLWPCRQCWTAYFWIQNAVALKVADNYKNSQ